MAKNASPWVANAVLVLLGMGISILIAVVGAQQRQITSIRHEHLALQKELPNTYVRTERYTCDVRDIKERFDRTDRVLLRLENKLDMALGGGHGGF